MIASRAADSLTSAPSREDGRITRHPHGDWLLMNSVCRRPSSESPARERHYRAEAFKIADPTRIPLKVLGRYKKPCYECELWEAYVGRDLATLFFVSDHGYYYYWDILDRSSGTQEAGMCIVATSWPEMAVHDSVYTVMVSMRSSALFCFGLG